MAISHAKSAGVIDIMPLGANIDSPDDHFGQDRLAGSNSARPARRQRNQAAPRAGRNHRVLPGRQRGFSGRRHGLHADRR